jgi:hypothetical protein
MLLNDLNYCWVGTTFYTYNYVIYVYFAELGTGREISRKSRRGWHLRIKGRGEEGGKAMRPVNLRAKRRQVGEIGVVLRKFSWG